MSTENQKEIVSPEENELEVEEIVSLKKNEYEKLNQTLGSLKRELKDLKKSKEEIKEKSEKDASLSPHKPDENRLTEKLERMSLRNAGITHPDDIELAKTTAKKWGVDVDEVIDDEDFKVKLERQRTNRDNVKATSNVRGGSAPAQAKNTVEYWQAKGQPPTPDDVSDRKIRQKIVKEMMRGAKQGLSGNPYYNG